MPILDVRRHAERATIPGTSALSAAGRAMAGSLAGTRYALVVASPLPRAQETARLIGGGLDGTEASLLPDIGGAELFGPIDTLVAWARLLAERDELRVFADQQLAAWSAIARRVGPRDRVLAVSHGGIIDLPAVALGHSLGLALAGPAFGYCEGVRVTYAKGAATHLELLRTGT